jgi:hypothetical protein
MWYSPTLLVKQSLPEILGKSYVRVYLSYIYFVLSFYAKKQTTISILTLVKNSDIRRQ